MRPFLLAFCLLAGVAGAAQPVAPWRASTSEEQRLDAAAFEGFDKGIAERLTDIESVAVILKGRTAYQYHRDGNPEALRDTQSVAKSALAALSASRCGRAISLRSTGRWWNWCRSGVSSTQIRGRRQSLCITCSQ